MWALGAKGGIRSVAGIYPGVVLIDVEDPGLDIVHERGESLMVALDVTDTARKERVAGPDVSLRHHIVVDQCDRSRGVATQVDDVQGDVTEGDRVSVCQATSGQDRQCVGVGFPGRGHRPGRRHDLGQGTVVIPVLVGRHDHVKAAAALAQQRHDSRRVVRCVDEQLCARARAGQQVDVVRHRPNARFADRQPRQVTLEARSVSDCITGVVHEDHLVTGYLVTNDYCSTLIQRRLFKSLLQIWHRWSVHFVMIWYQLSMTWHLFSSGEGRIVPSWGERRITRHGIWGVDSGYCRGFKADWSGEASVQPS